MSNLLYKILIPYSVHIKLVCNFYVLFYCNTTPKQVLSSPANVSNTYSTEYLSLITPTCTLYMYLGSNILPWMTDVKVKCICHPVCHFSDNLQVSFIKELVFYLFVAVLEFSSGIAGGYRCLCPSFWPQCHQKMQKPTTTSGLSSTTVFSITKVDNKT